MDVCGSLELNNAALSFTYLVSAALVRKVRPTALTSNTGASRLSPMSKGETRGSSTTSNDDPPRLRLAYVADFPFPDFGDELLALPILVDELDAGGLQCALGPQGLSPLSWMSRRRLTPRGKSWRRSATNAVQDLLHSSESGSEQL